VKVKIISCDNPIRWYSRKIGKIFEVRQPNNYIVNDSRVGYYCCIRFEDARPLKRVEAKKTPRKVKGVERVASRAHNTTKIKICPHWKIWNKGGTGEFGACDCGGKL